MDSGRKKHAPQLNKTTYLMGHSCSTATICSQEHHLEQGFLTREISIPLRDLEQNDGVVGLDLKTTAEKNNLLL